MQKKPEMQNKTIVKQVFYCQQIFFSNEDNPY